MNKYNRTALNIFITKENISLIYDESNEFYRDKQVKKFLNDNLLNIVKNFYDKKERDFLVTKELGPVYKDQQDVAGVVDTLNIEFFGYLDNFINTVYSRPNKVWSETKEIQPDLMNYAPRTQLCDTNTSMVDDEMIYWKKLDPSNNLMQKIDYNTEKHFRHGLNNFYGDLSDDKLEKMRYSYRLQQPRDDSVGALTQPKGGGVDMDINMSVEEDFNVSRDYDNIQPESSGFEKVLDPLNRLMAPKLIQELNKPEHYGVDMSSDGKYYLADSNRESTSNTPKVFNLMSEIVRLQDKVFEFSKDVEGIISYDQYPTKDIRKEGFTTNLSAAEDTMRREYEEDYRRLGENGAADVLDGLEYVRYRDDRMAKNRKYENCGDRPMRPAKTSLEYMPKAPADRSAGELNLFKESFRTSPCETQQYSERNTFDDPRDYQTKPYSFLESAYTRDTKGYRDVTMAGLNNCSDPQGLKLWQNGAGFVDDTDPEAMRRLLTRKTFRSYNKDGSQIPWYIRNMHVRNYDREVDEAVGGFEYDCQSRGYGEDLKSLYCRIQNKPKEEECVEYIKTPRQKNAWAWFNRD